MSILKVKVLVSRMFKHLTIMQRASGPDGIDTTGIVVFVPAPAIVFPDGVFDPLLGVRVEGVGDGLFRTPGFEMCGLLLVD